LIAGINKFLIVDLQGESITGSVYVTLYFTSIVLALITFGCISLAGITIREAPPRLEEKRPPAPSARVQARPSLRVRPPPEPEPPLEPEPESGSTGMPPEEKKEPEKKKPEVNLPGWLDSPGGESGKEGESETN